MKHSSFKIICLIIWACVMVSTAFGQYRNTNWTSRVLESFNGNDDAPYIWKTQSSRYISAIRDESDQPVQDNEGNTAKYPILTFVEAFPRDAFRPLPEGDNPLRSFGLNARFDRKGYNWIDLYPVLADDPDGKPFEIPMPGRVRELDVWVWGSNLRYYIEVYIRDYRGVVHTLKLGDISYPGWRNLCISIPNSIPQERRILPSYAQLEFVKFRIWTLPTERVDNFYIYIKQLKILTDIFEGLFDGSDLADPDNVEKIWSNN